MRRKVRHRARIGIVLKASLSFASPINIDLGFHVSNHIFSLKIQHLFRITEFKFHPAFLDDSMDQKVVITRCTSDAILTWEPYSQRELLFRGSIVIGRPIASRAKQQ